MIGTPNGTADVFDVSDIDNDGHLDVTIGTTAGVEILYGAGNSTFGSSVTGDGSFAGGVTYTTGASALRRSVIADVDGDNVADIITNDNGAGGCDQVRVMDRFCCDDNL